MTPVYKSQIFQRFSLFNHIGQGVTWLKTQLVLIPLEIRNCTFLSLWKGKDKLFNFAWLLKS